MRNAVCCVQVQSKFVPSHFALLALEGLAVLIDRRQNLIGPLGLPAVRSAQNPLDLLIAADFDNRGLMTRGMMMESSVGS